MVDLIHEGEDRDPAIRADLEELLRLRFDALCHIDDHDRRVDGHQRAVGIFRKVRMPRGIQDIDAAPLVVELQHPPARWLRRRAGTFPSAWFYRRPGAK